MVVCLVDAKVLLRAVLKAPQSAAMWASLKVPKSVDSTVQKKAATRAATWVE